MKKMLLLFSVFVLFSCRSLSMQEMSASYDPIANRLPYLEPVIDKSSLAALDDRVSISSKNKNFYYRKSTGRRSADVSTFFREEVKQNISTPTGDKKGTITLRILDSNTQGCAMCKVALIGTLGISSFVGVPADRLTQEVRVEVEIKDNKKNVLGSYVAITSNEVPVAMYYGYKKSDAQALNTISNLKKAMSDIKIQIQNDYPELKKKLK